MKSIGFVPEQIGELKIPMVQGGRDSKNEEERYRRYLKESSLDPKKMAVLDALEVYYPARVAAFLNDSLSIYLYSDS